jgi:hypothetical protein
MDISIFTIGSQVFGDKPVFLELKYQDITGRQFQERQILDPSKSLGPLKFGDVMLEDIKRSIEEMAKEISQLRRTVELYPIRLQQEEHEEG